MKNKLKLLAERLRNWEQYVSDYSGSQERAIANAQTEIVQKIGDMLEEVLDMDEEEVETELKEKQ